MATGENKYDRLYVEYLYYFNVARDYFECHEVLEELWMEEGRKPLWQGLLQVAVALYHFSGNNVSGAIKLFDAAIAKLEPYPADAAGIDLAKLVQESRTYADRLRRYDEEPFPFYDLTITVLDPELAEQVERLKSNPPSGDED